MELSLMDVADFRVEISAVQLLCKVSESDKMMALVDLCLSSVSFVGRGKGSGKGRALPS